MNAAVQQFRSAVRGPVERARSLIRRGRIESSDEAAPERTEGLLFDGTEQTFEDWHELGAAACERRGDELHFSAGTEIGLLFYGPRRFSDLRLLFQYRLASPDARVSLAVHFRDPRRPVPDREDPSAHYAFENPACVVEYTGFEVELGLRRRGVAPGTFHAVLVGNAPGAQRRVADASVKLDDFNDVELVVVGKLYTVRINGVETARFTNLDDYRGQRAEADPHTGFIGFLTRRGGVTLRRIVVEPPPSSTTASHGVSTEGVNR